MSFIIYGVEGNSGTLNMNENGSTASKLIFTRGTERKIAIILKKDIGEIYSLRVWHDNSGDAPSWYLEDVTITNPNSGSCWKFVFETWLSLEDESYSSEVLQNPFCSGPKITTKGKCFPMAISGCQSLPKPQKTLLPEYKGFHHAFVCCSVQWLLMLHFITGERNHTKPST